MRLASWIAVALGALSASPTMAAKYYQYDFQVNGDVVRFFNGPPYGSQIIDKVGFVLSFTIEERTFGGQFGAWSSGNTLYLHDFHGEHVFATLNFNHDLGNLLPSSSAGFVGGKYESFLGKCSCYSFDRTFGTVDWLRAQTYDAPDGAGWSLKTLASWNNVPEPDTWMMMVLGFGAVGYAVRRRGRYFYRLTDGHAV